MKYDKFFKKWSPLKRFGVDRYTVKPLIKDNPEEDKPPNKGQAPIYTLYRKSPRAERGQPLYKGQNGWSRRCPPLLRGSNCNSSVHVIGGKLASTQLYCNARAN